MARIPFYRSPLHKNLTAPIILTCLMCIGSSAQSKSIFAPETFESCGIFLQNSQPYTRRQEDINYFKTYYFCTFCESGLVLLNSMKTNILSINLLSFKKIWLHAAHNYYVSNQGEIGNEHLCTMKNVIHIVETYFFPLFLCATEKASWPCES